MLKRRVRLCFLWACSNMEVFVDSSEAGGAAQRASDPVQLVLARRAARERAAGYGGGLRWPFL
eukprot:scaffold142101_cov31-Tisochrysis_lutea.AAC.2